MREPPSRPIHDNVTSLDDKRRSGRLPASGVFANPLRFRTMRTVTFTTTGVDRPLTIRVLIDVSLQAYHVMHVLWAATGLAPDSSALLSRYEHDGEPHYFGIAASWENSANRDRVTGLDAVQFGQLFLPGTELYAELDPARGYRARIQLEAENALGDEAEGMPGSSVRITHAPFGIPTGLTANETDVLLQASDGEQLSPLQQQILVQLAEPIDLPRSDISQAIALATFHGVRLGVQPEFMQLIPWAMVEMPSALPARELLRFVHASDRGMKVTKSGKMPVSELRRLLNAPNVDYEIFDVSADIAPDQLKLSVAPLVQSAWDVLQDTGVIAIDNQRAVLSTDLGLLPTVTAEELDSYFEAVFLRLILEQGFIDVDGLAAADVHPTLEYETAQDYADSLISSAIAAPEEALQQFIDEHMLDSFDPDEQREHLEFTIELLYMPQPVTRRMSVPMNANLHASIETILVMFGWQLTHLWQLDLVDADGIRQPGAASYRDSHLEVPLAADLQVADILRPEGPQALLTYDFGDGWEMLITPLGTRTAASTGELLVAEGPCPPEDSGGPGGYEMKLLAMRDPEEFQRQYPDFESEEIRELANWARTNGAGTRVPEPDSYELYEHALPYDI